MGVADVTVLAPLRFGEFVLDEAGFALRRDGRPVEIEPRALKLLLHLARNRQRAVPRAELAAILWPDHAVSEKTAAPRTHSNSTRLSFLRCAKTTLVLYAPVLLRTARAMSSRAIIPATAPS